MKLGKNEKVILKALLLDNHEYFRMMGCPRSHGQIPEGKSIEMLARYVYPGKEINVQYGGMIDSIKCSISRSLKHLYNERLVKVAKPIYKNEWCPAEEDARGEHVSGMMCRRLVGFHVKELGENGAPLGDWECSQIEVYKHASLETNTKKIFLLTDKGKQIAAGLDFSLETKGLEAEGLRRKDLFSRIG